MDYNKWAKFFIIWENSKIEQYTVSWFYTYNYINKETNLEEVKTYFVYQKWENVMTISEQHMFYSLDEVKERAIELLNKEIEKVENIKKDILETNF